METKTSKTLNIILWLLQVLLASSLIWAASLKLFQDPAKLAVMWPWTADNHGLVKITGVIDLLAGLGLILPGVLRIQPRLVIYSAYGIVVLMIAACVFHISRGEAALIGVNICFALMAVLVAWGRQKKAPISAK